MQERRAIRRHERDVSAQRITCDIGIAKSIRQIEQRKPRRRTVGLRRHQMPEDRVCHRAVAIRTFEMAAHQCPSVWMVPLQHLDHSRRLTSAAAKDRWQQSRHPGERLQYIRACRVARERTGVRSLGASRSAVPDRDAAAIANLQVSLANHRQQLGRTVGASGQHHQRRIRLPARQKRARVCRISGRLLHHQCHTCADQYPQARAGGALGVGCGATQRVVLLHITPRFTDRRRERACNIRVGGRGQPTDVGPERLELRGRLVTSRHDQHDACARSGQCITLIYEQLHRLWIAGLGLVQDDLRLEPFELLPWRGLLQQRKLAVMRAHCLQQSTRCRGRTVPAVADRWRQRAQCGQDLRHELLRCLRTTGGHLLLVQTLNARITPESGIGWLVSQAATIHVANVGTSGRAARQHFAEHPDQQQYQQKRNQPGQRNQGVQPRDPPHRKIRVRARDHLANGEPSRVGRPRHDRPFRQQQECDGCRDEACRLE